MNHKRLKQYRKDSGLRMIDIDIKSGISSSYLSQMESGQISKPSAEVMCKLSILYGVDMHTFLVSLDMLPKTDYKVSLLKTISIQLDNMTKEEENEIIGFVKFLRWKRKKV